MESKCCEVVPGGRSKKWLVDTVGLEYSNPQTGKQLVDDHDF